MRNYDGLGGQLLFAFLHDRGVVHWTDNRLRIDWERVEEAVGELRELVEELYRHGIDRARSRTGSPRTTSSRGTCRPTSARSGVRRRASYSDEAEPRAWIDRVLDDEFPLSMFYEALKKKVAA